MKNYTPTKILSLILLFIAASVSLSYAGNLFIEPYAPFVSLGGTISLSVTNANGNVKWKAFHGEIEKTGNSVKYKAPDKVTIDAVSAMDSTGKMGVVRVVVQEQKYIDELFSKENANWEIFTNRDNIKAILLSDDGATLWVGTAGGLEERNASTGKLKRIYTKQNGLPSNSIYSLESDGSGGLWVGTYEGGLAHLKSDGSWQIFDEKNSELPDNAVYSLLSDGIGGLWIGTWGGLAHFKADGSWQVFNPYNNSGLPLNYVYNYVYSLLSDGSGGLWVGTHGGGLAHLKSDGSWQVFDKDNSGLPDNSVPVLLSDNSGGLWIGTTLGGLAHLKSDGSWEVFNTDNSGLPENYINTLFSDGSGGLWIGTDRGGLAHLKSDGSCEVFNTDNSELPDNYVYPLLSDGIGGLWIGTEYGGLAHLKSDGSWEVFNKDNSELPYNNVSALLSDNSGGLWAKHKGGGLAHLKSDGSWEVFNTDNSGLPDNYVTTLFSDSSGGLWVGTHSGGLAHFKADGSWEVFNTDNSELPANNVYLLLSDNSGGLWVGLWIGNADRGGLAHLKSDGSCEVFNTDNSGLPDDDVKSLLSDNSGGLWIGTWGGGLAHFKADGSWEVFNRDNSGLPENYVYSPLLSDGSGGLWIGIDNRGLAHFKADGSWEVFNRDNSGLPDDDVDSLLSDNSGGLWIGTRYGNLAHLKSDGSWEVFNEKNSDLPFHYVGNLLSDGNGGLWIGHLDRGLTHLTYSSPKVQEEQYLTGGRAAIIIAGGGNTKDNILWDSTAAICNYTYKMLNRRGFLNTDIHYISPQPFADFNGDGLDDRIVDAPKPARQLQLSDIQAAFDWAETKGTLNQPLYIFFTDHGGDSRLLLSWGEVYLEAAELKAMLDDYQKTTGNKVVVVIDACHAGTMVKALAGENRAIISSTDDGPAYFDRMEDQSFTYFVTKGLSKGMNFVEAFDYAADRQKKLLGKLSDYNMVTGGEGGNLSQEPQFDDNGDGLYNISVDGDWLKKVSVNGTFTTADITLMVEAVTQSGTIPASNNVVSGSGSGGSSSGAVPLKAKATLANGRVNRVWAVIRPPQMDILVDDTGVPIMAFPKIDLSLSKTEADIYEGSWNGFVYNGEYEITFYAQDNQGNIEGSESILLTVADGLACPQKASLKVSATGNSINDSLANPDSTGKIIYKSGDTLKVSVTENLAYGYDLYVALLMPDGNFMALKNPLTNENMNQLQKENFNKLYWGDRWIETNRNINMGKSVDVVDLILPQEKLPSGQYCVYAALIPERQDLMVSAGKGLFVIDGVCFEVVENK